ncbi:hypothetical protein ACFLVS_04110 [Chloroflexota bacterium]
MTDLYLHNRQVDNVFQLLGDHENDISYSVAWALARCPCFLNAFLNSEIKYKPKAEEVLIRLQHSEKKGNRRKSGITDMEIECPGSLYVIIEAKKGWDLPGYKQLEKYGNRPSFRDSKAPEKLILVLSECRREYAIAHLEVNNVLGVPVRPLSWQRVAELARLARAESSHAEKRVIDELLTYLEGLKSMQDCFSNMVFIVALGNEKPENWDISWIDIVNKRRRYFHPVGKRWPKDPPNYIGFRYFGKLQSIHHIEGYDIFTSPNEMFPEIPDNKWDPHFLYELGPAIIPPGKVRSENIRNRHVWCMLDTLLIADTISGAKSITDRRKERASVD